MRRVLPRDPVFLPSAKQVNATADAVAAVQMAAPNAGTLQRAPDLRVLNATEDTLPPGSVLMIDDLLIPPSPNRAPSTWLRFPGFRGVTPELRPQPSAIVLTTATIKPNAVGPCVLDATLWAQIRIDDEAHQCADFIAGQTRRLRSARVGAARILARERTPYPLPDNYLGPWCLIHLAGIDGQLNASQVRFGYVDQSVTAGEVSDRDADGDADTYDDEDPDTTVDDDLTPGRGSVHLWDFQISRRADRRFAILGFVQTGTDPVTSEPVYDQSQPIVSDPDGSLLGLTVDDRVYVDQSTRSNGYYYCTGEASWDGSQTTLALNAELTALPDPNPDEEVLGDIVTEAWAPVWQRDADGAIVLAEQSVYRVDADGDAIPDQTALLPVREDPVEVWNLWEQTSLTTATPVRIVREHDRWQIVNGGCYISDLDMTPDVDL